ncbi:hypothetical protein [Niabella sp.]|uniref:hypothetical protein n=1 Tax=Niabella sp. TaxID=1962976 RepID=UPI002607F555|nr:hypothetical protein [Niabella sp.]
MKQVVFSIVAGSLLVVGSCAKTGADVKAVIPGPPETSKVPQTEYDVTQLAYCALFESTPVVTLMQRQDYNELSGIAAGMRNPGILYMHNDNRNAPVIISNAAGDDLGKIILDGVTTVNPEDIRVGPGPEAGKTYIYYADIGDNNRSRAAVTVYRFEEPVLSNPAAGTEIHISNIAKIVLKYPSATYNAETLLVDPVTKDIFIATKETNRSTLYRAAYPQSETIVTTMEPVLTMRFFDSFTSGDISAHGKEILLRNKSQVWYWPRNVAKSVAETLQTPPQMAPYAGNEHQGEGIAFAYSGSSGYFTNTEIRDYTGAVSRLSFYKKK